MRFVFGVVLGFGIGFAAAILLAPEKTKKEPQWTPRSQSEAESPNGANRVVGTIKERVNEAMSEARQARKDAEREMRARYERTVGRKADQ